MQSVDQDLVRCPFASLQLRLLRLLSLEGVGLGKFSVSPSTSIVSFGAVTSFPNADEVAEDVEPLEGLDICTAAGEEPRDFISLRRAGDEREEPVASVAEPPVVVERGVKILAFDDSANESVIGST